MSKYIVRGYITQDVEIEVEAESIHEAKEKALLAPTDDWGFVDSSFELTHPDLWEEV